MTHSSSLAMQPYSIEPRTRRYVTGFKKQLLDTGLEALKNSAKK